MKTKTQSEIERATLLPLLRRRVQGKGVFSHVVKRERCYTALLTNVYIGSKFVDHVRVIVPKGFYVHKKQVIDFEATVHRYGVKCGLKDFSLI